MQLLLPYAEELVLGNDRELHTIVAGVCGKNFIAFYPDKLINGYTLWPKNDSNRDLIADVSKLTLEQISSVAKHGVVINTNNIVPVNEPKLRLVYSEERQRYVAVGNTVYLFSFLSFSGDNPPEEITLNGDVLGCALYEGNTTIWLDDTFIYICNKNFMALEWQ